MVDCTIERCDPTESEQDELIDLRTRILEGEGDTPSCEQRLTDPEFLQFLSRATALECGSDTWREKACGEWGFAEICGCEPPANLNEPCTDSDQCDEGDLSFAVCVDGVCSAMYCPTSEGPVGSVTRYAGCGESNLCYQNGFPDGEGGYATIHGVCIGGCRNGSDCPADMFCHAFEVLSEDESGFDVAAICRLPCDDDSQCQPWMNGICRDGRCEFECRSDGAVCASLGGECVSTRDGTRYCTLPE